MNITAQTASGGLTVFLEGELDHHAAKRAMRAIEEQIDLELPRRCRLDLRDLRFMDSSGIAVILKTKRRMEEIGGDVTVVNVRPQPEKVLRAAGLERLIRITALKGE